jgi:hypothetical protein
MKKTLILLALILPAQSNAGIVYNATSSKSQVTMSRAANGVAACGIRTTVVVGIGDQSYLYDFSGSVYRDGMFGLWKAGSYAQPTSKLLTSPVALEKAVVTPAPTGFWLAESGSNIPVTMTQTAPAEDKGFTLGPGDFIATMRSVSAIAQGNSGQFSLAYKSDKVEKIIAFKAPLSEADYGTLLQCFSGLIEGIEYDHKEIIDEK